MGIFTHHACAQEEQSALPLNNEPSDSLLEKYSIEDLLEYKKYYLSEINKLEGEKKELRDKGIAEAEAFIKQHPESRILDKILLRLAELHYQKAEDDYLNAMNAFDDIMEKRSENDTIPLPDEPQLDLGVSLELYERIIADFPQSSLVDDALYNKGFLLEQTTQKDSARTVYQKIIDEFPDSRYVPDAMMRIAEYYFNPPINDLENAISIYKQILYYKDSPKYDEALYRLGWSFYRLDMYPEAVSYFTLLADDVERAKVLDPTQKYTNPDLHDESVEYIGISFLDYGGAEGAATYLTDIGGRAYGFKVLQRIGDAYMEEKEEYARAIEAYEILLKMYPFAPESPKIQNKIIRSYQYLEDDRMTYFARDKLFNNYRPGSTWWEKNSTEQARKDSRSLTERAMRENINLLFQRAEESGSIDLYSQVISDSRKYLESFPDDSNAVLIHWNLAWALDTKLKNYELAYDEYLKISDFYWDTRYQKYAAENAIVIAKELVARADSIKKATEGDEVASVQPTEKIDLTANFRNAIAYQTREMSAADMRLAEAYNNYIMLFPHEAEAAVILTNAGALYYNHNQFREALKYFNTVVKHFPNSENVDFAKYTIMECYFGKRDFRSSEIVAKKLRESSASTEITEKAVKRLAESIFLNAEALSESGEHLKAGNEYVRVVLEVPTAPFADLSLFNGAYEYDKAKEYRRAVETYDYLIENYSRSKYRLDAINNLAIDYGELKENRNAAITYEKLAEEHPDTNRSRDALFNSSVFYVRAEDWKSAIRVNKEYVRKYPGSEDADDLYFDIAGYYLKLGELEKANQIYGDYALKYPESPRVVETYFHRGEYYKANNNLVRAKQEFDMAIHKSAELKGKNIDGNDFYAAEALFKLTEIQFEEYSQIEFRMPQSALDEAKKNKKQMLMLIVENYTKVARYGTVRLYEATYNIARAYEEFAETWARQELPEMTETRRIVALKEINQTSAELYERAISSFQNSVQVLTRIADDFEASIKSTTFASADSAVDSTSLASTGGRVTIEDSTLYVARKWIERSKEKVSEIIYDVAELNYESVNQFLAAPIPDELDEIAAMEYRNQVLNKAIRPLLQQIVDAHARNIYVAREMNLANQWIDLSKRRVVVSSNILPDEYYKMAKDAFLIYSEKNQLYHTLVNSGKDASDISDQMATVIDYGKAFGKASITFYKNTLTKAQEVVIEDPLIEETELALLKTVYALSKIADSLSVDANKSKKTFETLYKETDKIEFEDGLLAMDDCYFSFKDAQKEFLELGFTISKDFGITNPWTNNIILELVRTNPEEYGNLIELTSVLKVEATDSSWFATPAYKKGWTTLEFNMEDWSKAYIVMDEPEIDAEDAKRIWCMKIDTIEISTPLELADQTADSAAIGVRSDAGDTSAIVGPQIVASDSGNDLAVMRTFEYRKVPTTRTFFRKAVEIEGLPVSGEIHISADDSYNLFFNGEYIAAAGAQDSISWEVDKSHNLTDYLKAGKNIIAIECSDEDKSGRGLRAIIKLQTLPGWEEKRKKLRFQMLDSITRQNLIFNKNILIY
ncbi:tetratricopeptide repeat protein [candidate division KSB1 bacterium]|nr:tetratricopeptide repeat protein [candidate division KSB1 bacterium]